MVNASFTVINQSAYNDQMHIFKSYVKNLIAVKGVLS